jgi:hypothetical protein
MRVFGDFFRGRYNNRPPGRLRLRTMARLSVAFACAVLGATIILVYRPFYQEHVIMRSLEATGAKVLCDSYPPWPFTDSTSGSTFDRITGVHLKSGYSSADDFSNFGSSDLSRKHIDAATLEQLWRCVYLIDVDLSGTDIADDGLRGIQQLRGLQILTLSETMVGDTSLKFIGSLNSLQMLTLRRTAISDDGLGSLEKLPALWDLDLCGTRVGDSGAARLSRFQCLTWLGLSRSRITDDGLGQIGRMKQLTRLSLNCTTVTDKGLRHLTTLTNLSDLSLSCTRISDSGLRYLQGLTELHTLRLCRTRITDAGIAYLGGAQCLWLLDIRGTKISREGAEKLRRMLPNLRELYSDYDSTIPKTTVGQWPSKVAPPEERHAPNQRKEQSTGKGA